MKVCPICKSRTKSDIECPICKATITYEPIVEAKRQKYVINKYLIWYLIKKLWFSLACIAVVTFRIIYKTFDAQIIFTIYFLAIVSFIFSLFKDTAFKYEFKNYSKKYAYYFHWSRILLLGGLAVIFSFVIK